MPDYELDEGVDEMFEVDEGVDEGSDEAARSWSRPRPKTASGRNLYSPRPQTQYVTQAQLQTALAKVGSQVRTNSNAISQVGGRLAAATAAMKKESGDRKKDLTAVKNNLSQTQQMAAILPLLTQPGHITTSQPVMDSTGTTTIINSGTELLVGSDSNTNLLLPMLLLTSVGDGSSGSGGGGLFGGGGGDGNSSLLMLALVLGLGK
jgi:hypothetical protein